MSPKRLFIREVDNLHYCLMYDHPKSPSVVRGVLETLYAAYERRRDGYLIDAPPKFMEMLNDQFQNKGSDDND